eukprot:TRINITY_DN10973_c0_g1_i2.p1 TRINITY_DN10973_c0_g1~~TRINITY_DN10973_c0_g1_i2.p1  ORF type:complete len:182 (-),score=20.89 TRINITY_DN10973_c0_g1_i2:27-572(-)
MIRRPPRSTHCISSAASDVYKRQVHGDKHDPSYAPLMNQGPAIKLNANFRYATTAESSSRFEAICESSGTPVQKIINRSDMPCGSTVGPMTSAALSIPAVDIGNPMWAMHSIRETMGVYDHEYLINALTWFYNHGAQYLSLIHISEPTRLGMISYAVFCLKKKKTKNKKTMHKTYLWVTST